MYNQKINRFIKSIQEYYKDLEENNTSRFLAWDYCYEVFSDARNKSIDDAYLDYLCLHLSNYLFNFGMGRNSFILEHNYHIHKEVVKEILKPEYNVLCGISAYELKKEENSKLLISLYDTIYRIYKDEIDKDFSKKILITKILYGTLACTPAFDTHVQGALRTIGISSRGGFNLKNIQKICEFYQENKTKIENKLYLDNPERKRYPDMKLIDMGLFNIN